MTREELIYKAEGSRRYHRYRSQHFTARDRWTAGINAFSGAGVVVGILATVPNIALVFGTFIAVLNAYRLVAKPDEISLNHDKLCREWAKLRGEAEALALQNVPSEYVTKAGELDGESPDDMKVVQAHCINEVLTLFQLPGKHFKFTWFQWWTRNIFSHTRAFADQNRAFSVALAKNQAGTLSSLPRSEVTSAVGNQ